VDSSTIVAILFGVALVALVILGLRRSRRRGTEIRTWARDNGWRYAKSSPPVNRNWRAPIVRGGSVDHLLWNDFPEGQIFSFENVYRAGAGPALTRNVNGADLGAHVPTALILPQGHAYKTAPKYTPVEFSDGGFNTRWRVLAEQPEEVSTIHELLTPGFRRRLLGNDGLLLIDSPLALEDHYLLLVAGGEMQLGNVNPAAELLRDLISELPHPLPQGSPKH